MPNVAFSVLDLSPIVLGSDAATAFRNTVDLARQAEALGYQRYWLAEHHNMTGIASAATAVVIGHVAGATRSIRVGAGGIMLPNHSPLVIAEQFGTLESLYPGRIDLGLGRAPGTDQLTARALRRERMETSDDFPQDVIELQHYFQPVDPAPAVKAVPGMGLNVPIWILGSSLFGAQLAAHLGLPYAFASHFAPDQLLPAINIYRQHFRPSAALQKPHVMAGVNVIAAATDSEAAVLFTSLQQQFLNMRRNRRGQLPPPVPDIEELWAPHEKASVQQSLACAVVGGPDTVREGLRAFIERTGVDELMITAQIYDHASRMRSFELAAQARDALHA
ncbi:Luciferase-like monooxygenase, FMN-dependent [plant metagenome]|uniref:Luciferase-like monooxygenase n=2 Tax=root TaxID=1 RepID=A0A1C3K073_9BURK|nr:LLM class flavin-dependent oxidoreductase [Orrella dioscoreae]SBT24808.1 Luciferase-like monooxygenase, FMN-dependent [Orrella dioscoreae]SOE50566.1 Luciferase-like monooxygenase, FMN-dependent [Orrella dioscoreae]